MTDFFAPEYGAKFTLSSPAGTAVFNDATDGNYVGELTAIEGLDGAEIREGGENLVEFDGGIHDDRFFYGRRPVSLQGVIRGYTTVSGRNTIMQKLSDVVHAAMTSNATLKWTPSGASGNVTLSLRKQLPMRFDGGWMKTFNAGMVAGDPRVYSEFSSSADFTTPTTVSHTGNVESQPVYTLYGPYSSGATVVLDANNVFTLGQALLDTDALVVDTKLRTVKRFQRVKRINQAIDPSFENASVVGFTTDTANTTVTKTTAQALFGTKSLNLHSTLGGLTDMRVTAFANTAATTRIPLTVGTTNITVAYWAKRDATHYTTPQTVGKVTFYNTGGSVISSTQVLGTPPVNVTWVQYMNVFTVPALTTSYTVQIGVNATTTTSGADLWIDGLMIENAGPIDSDGSFFYPGTDPAYWSGTTDASTSTYLPTTFDTDYPVINGWQYLDLAASKWSGLNPNTTPTLGSTGAGGNGAVANAGWYNTWI